MKKLIALAMVLGVVGLVNAGMTTTGLEMKFIANADGTFNVQSLTNYQSGKDTYYAIVSDKGAAGGSVVAGAPSDTTINNNALTDGSLAGVLPAGLDGVWGFIGSTTGTAANAGLWLQNIQVDKMATELRLYEITANWELGNLVATIVPEPMTMALLALGGLFVRRK